MGVPKAQAGVLLGLNKLVVAPVGSNLTVVGEAGEPTFKRCVIAQPSAHQSLNASSGVVGGWQDDQENSNSGFFPRPTTEAVHGNNYFREAL